LCCCIFPLSSHCQKDYGYDLIKRAFSISDTLPDSSIFYAKRAIEIGARQKDKHLITNGYLEVGRAYRIKNNPQQAISYLFKTIESSPETKKGKNLTSAAYSELGNVFYIIGENEKAKINYIKGYQLKRKLKRDEEAAFAATQLAGIYSISSTPDSTFHYAGFAIPYLQKKGNESYLANIYNSMGAAHQMQYNLDSSLFYYTKASDMFTELGFNDQSAATLYNVAGIYVETEQFEEAEASYYKGLELIDKGSNLQTKAAIYTELAKLYRKTRNFEKYIEVDLIKDSVWMEYYSVNKNKAVLEIAEKYESSQKDKKLQQKQIEIQSRDLRISEAESSFYKLLVGGILVLFVFGLVVIWILLKRRSDRKLKQEKDRFFSNVVHEFRTPLTLISGPIQSLKTSTSRTEDLKKLNLMERNTKRLSDLVNQLLDVSKIDAKKYQSNSSIGNLSLFFEEIVDRMEPMASEKRILLHTDFSTADKNIRIDFEALEKISVNLISNAIKYSNAETTVEITVKLEGRNLKLTVADEGLGISESDQKKIFERFNQGKNGKTNQGIGIGLTLVSELVSMLDGELKLSSKVNSGSTFKVTLPFSSAVSPSNTTGSNSEHTILLLEDDSDMAAFITGVLNEKQLITKRVKNGVEALDYLETQLPELIISDIMMPDMDGYDFVSEIKAQPLLSHLPVIMLSAKAAQESKIKGLKKGAEIYLEKPFNPEELILTVQNNLKAKEILREKFQAQITSKDVPFEEKITSDDPFIQNLNKLILKELENSELGMEALSSQLAISRSQLHRKVKAITGYNTSTYIRIIRLEKALTLLKNKFGNVTEVAYATGFSSQSYFTKCFTEHFGYPPSQLTTKLQ